MTSAISRDTLVQHARGSIRRGSKSFASASRLFDRTTRERVWLLYAWCRACDDIADAQDHGGEMGEQSDMPERIAAIRTLTARAFANEPTGDPSFDALGVLSREVGITPAMADDVIAGFALDAEEWRPRTEADLLRYCYHVAGAVGVMMAVVMGVPPQDEDTLDRACDLGIAFQLANIARDVVEDAAAGRCYLPGEWLEASEIVPAEMLKEPYRPALVALIRRLCTLERGYEASARVGAARLAFRQRWAVLSAAGIYGAIARKVEAAGPRSLERRITTSKPEKLRHIVNGLREAVLARPTDASHPVLSRRELTHYSPLP